jgi:hypothetical protein
MLNKFENGTSHYVNSIFTGDETWLYFCDVATKAQNKVCVFEDENTPMSMRKSRSMKRRVAIFFTIRGVVEHMVLEVQKRVTTNWYNKECLPRVVNTLRTAQQISDFPFKTWWTGRQISDF